MTATMSATIIDSAIFRDILSTEAMRRVFADASRIQKYLDFEAALATAQARLGIIPPQAADEIVHHCDAGQIDFVKLKSETERVGYPVLPVVKQLVALCRAGHGQWCHWGATTQDVTDTATVLQIREALTLIEADIDAIAAALAGLARKHRDTPMAGRSNLQQAVPITRCSPPSAAISSASTSCARGCWSASSAAQPARLPRSAAAASKCRPS
jgi:3-carboxy-cis,cis-muconate cycloisomerase